MNEVIVQSTQENHFLRDRNLLGGALSRPISQFEYEGMDSVVDLAAHLALAIGKAHAFEQGNKRTAWAAAQLFIRNNGYDLQLDDGIQHIIAVVIEQMVGEDVDIKHLIYFINETIRVG
ncbi:type II toxin-antitoxin system death-on-curing family toxin (plasmid) [Rhizobium ruizarguesonis]|nr:type II toxin-antitoxin system death-on-curing family toxin [Rhizobium ruizarguesonis]